MKAKCSILPSMQTISPLNTTKYYHCVQKLSVSAEIVSGTSGLERSNCYLPVIPVRSPHILSAVLEITTFLPKDQLRFTSPWKQQVFPSCRGEQWILTVSHWRPWEPLYLGSYLWWHIQFPSLIVEAEVWSLGAQVKTQGVEGLQAAADEQLFVLAILH